MILIIMIDDLQKNLTNNLWNIYELSTFKLPSSNGLLTVDI